MKQNIIMYANPVHSAEFLLFPPPLQPSANINKTRDPTEFLLASVTLALREIHGYLEIKWDLIFFTAHQNF